MSLCWLHKDPGNRACHAERSEESARGYEGFFAALSMTGEGEKDCAPHHSLNTYGASTGEDVLGEVLALVGGGNAGMV